MYIRTIKCFLDDIKHLNNSIKDLCNKDSVIEAWCKNPDIEQCSDPCIKNWYNKNIHDNKNEIEEWCKKLNAVSNNKKPEIKGKFAAHVQNKIAKKIMENPPVIITELRESKCGESNGRITNEELSEISSWIFSLPALAEILGSSKKNTAFLDAQIALEARYFTGKRPDVTIIGKTKKGDVAVVIIENKRWSSLANYTTQSKEEVWDYVRKKTILHPCKQVEYYRRSLKFFNSYVQDANVEVLTAVYMQNGTVAEYKDKKGFFDNKYEGLINDNPVFIGKKGYSVKGKGTLLQYLQRIIIGGDDRLAWSIYKSEVKFSQEYLSLLKDRLVTKNSFLEVQLELFKTLADETQDDIFRTIKKNLQNYKKEDKKCKKKVFIVEGAAGTGKSFLGLALLASIYDDVSVKETNKTIPRCLYITKGKVQRWVLEKNNIRLETIAYAPDSEPDSFPNSAEKYHCIICDDSQRYSQSFVDGRKVIQTIIEQANIVVFFYDKKQIVHVEDDITKKGIEDFVINFNKNIKDNQKKIQKPKCYYLEEQYRNQISSFWDIPFVNFIDNMLYKSGYKKNDDVKKLLMGEYEIALVDTTHELFSRVKMKNQIRGDNHTSRVVAGKGYRWFSKNNNMRVGPFRNEPCQYYEGNIYPKNKPDTFVTDEDSVKYVGNIDVSYGIDFQYIGVIVAPDLTYSSGEGVVVELKGHQHEDHNIIGYFTEKENNSIREKNKKYAEICETKYSTALEKCEEDKKKKQSPIKNDETKEKITIEDIIKNTYRVLLTRGEKGCYIYCCEQELQNHLKEEHIPLLKTGEVKQEDGKHIILCNDQDSRSYYWISDETKKKMEVKAQKILDETQKILDEVLIDKEITKEKATKMKKEAEIRKKIAEEILSIWEIGEIDKEGDEGKKVTFIVNENNKNDKGFDEAVSIELDAKTL